MRTTTSVSVACRPFCSLVAKFACEKKKTCGFRWMCIPTGNCRNRRDNNNYHNSRLKGTSVLMVYDRIRFARALVRRIPARATVCLWYYYYYYYCGQTIINNDRTAPRASKRKTETIKNVWKQKRKKWTSWPQRPENTPVASGRLRSARTTMS